MKRLSEFTPARVDLGVAGHSLPTQPLLEFRLAHARARDAVHFPLDTRSLLHDMSERGWDALAVHSAARNREQYLRRPDLGRQLNESSIADLQALNQMAYLIFVVADGLSALAIHRHAIPFLDTVFQQIGREHIGPIVVAKQARVALGDQIGSLLGAELSIVLIGERPGLSAPDSLGVYLTWNPQLGRTDAERNCISNIQPQGLDYRTAAYKLAFLISESRRRKISGVTLKETAGNLLISGSDLSTR